MGEDKRERAAGRLPLFCKRRLRLHFHTFFPIFKLLLQVRQGSITFYFYPERFTDIPNVSSLFTDITNVLRISRTFFYVLRISRTFYGYPEHFPTFYGYPERFTDIQNVSYVFTHIYIYSHFQFVVLTYLRFFLFFAIFRRCSTF